jgi:hypothetical protein
MTLKYKRPTPKEHGHTVVLDSDGDEVAWFMPIWGKYFPFAAENDNWHLAVYNKMPSNYTFKNRKELLIKLKELL